MKLSYSRAARAEPETSRCGRRACRAEAFREGGWRAENDEAENYVVYAIALHDSPKWSYGKMARIGGERTFETLDLPIRPVHKSPWIELGKTKATCSCC